MLDISELESYTVDFTDRKYNRIDRDVAEKGIDKVLDYNFQTLDCTRVLKDGMRAIQSIDYTYASKVTEILYLVEKHITKEEEQNKVISKLLDKHRINLEYEIANPPVIYDKKKGLTKFKTTDKNNKEKKEKVPREKRQSAAQTKLAIKAAKLNALSINLPLKKL